MTHFWIHHKLIDFRVRPYGAGTSSKVRLGRWHVRPCISVYVYGLYTLITAEILCARFQDSFVRVSALSSLYNYRIFDYKSTCSIRQLNSNQWRARVADVGVRKPRYFGIFSSTLSWENERHKRYECRDRLHTSAVTAGQFNFLWHQHSISCTYRKDSLIDIDVLNRINALRHKRMRLPNVGWSLLLLSAVLFVL